MKRHFIIAATLAALTLSAPAMAQEGGYAGLIAPASPQGTAATRQPAAPQNGYTGVMSAGEAEARIRATTPAAGSYIGGTMVQPRSAAAQTPGMPAMTTERERRIAELNEKQRAQQQDRIRIAREAMQQRQREILQKMDEQTRAIQQQQQYRR